jgi:hypothetical protein
VAVVAVIAGLLALLAWFFWPGTDTRAPVTRADIDDPRELEEAEREVQEAPDAESVRDWGPGVQKPPI